MLRVVRNPLYDSARPLDDAEHGVVTPEELEFARRTIVNWPAYAPSPLTALPGLARELGFASLQIKDEGQRFAVGSFKPLGAPYALALALAREVARQLGVERVEMAELWARRHADIVAKATTCAATSGNHGRALAWGARELGCHCVIFMPEATSANRESVVRSFGADVVRVPGDYDAAHAAAEGESARRGWLFAGDSPTRPDRGFAKAIMHGYALIGHEILAAPATAPATHLFVPAGSGCMAAAVAASLATYAGNQSRPRLIVVQPDAVNSMSNSLSAASLQPADGALTTVMDGLSVRSISELAWPLLRRRAMAAVTIDDAAALKALRTLDAPQAINDPRVVAGETGIAAVAGLMAAAANDEARAALELDETSRVVAVVSEGATDPDLRQRLLING